MNRRRYRLSPPPADAEAIVGEMIEFAPEDDRVNAGKPLPPTVELTPVGPPATVYEFRPEDDLVATRATRNEEQKVYQARSAAVVVSDLVWYTQRVSQLVKTQSLASQTEAIIRLNSIIRDHITAALAGAPGHTMTEPRMISTGDGTVCVFETTEAALQFAEQLHREAKRYNTVEKPEPPVLYRVGIAHGAVLYGQHSPAVSGLPLIVASRLNSVAPPGGIIVAEEAWSQLTRDSSESAQPGRHQLRSEFRRAAFSVKGEEYEGRLWSTETGGTE